MNWFLSGLAYFGAAQWQEQVQRRGDLFFAISVNDDAEWWKSDRHVQWQHIALVA